jgi:hypothetical protein
MRTKCRALAVFRPKNLAFWMVFLMEHPI